MILSVLVVFSQIAYLWITVEIILLYYKFIIMMFDRWIVNLLSDFCTSY